MKKSLDPGFWQDWNGQLKIDSRPILSMTSSPKTEIKPSGTHPRYFVFFAHLLGSSSSFIGKAEPQTALNRDRFSKVHRGGRCPRCRTGGWRETRLRIHYGAELGFDLISRASALAFIRVRRSTRGGLGSGPAIGCR
jgi:hypothetical protein